MAKYNYWHIISKVSKKYQKHNPQVKVGLVITHQYKKDNEGVCIIDIKEKKEYPSAYTLLYLGRILKTEDKDKMFEQLKKWIKEKGYQKIADKSKPKKCNKELKNEMEGEDE